MWILRDWLYTLWQLLVLKTEKNSHLYLLFQEYNWWGEIMSEETDCGNGSGHLFRILYLDYTVHILAQIYSWYSTTWTMALK